MTLLGLALAVSSALTWRAFPLTPLNRHPPQTIDLSRPGTAPSPEIAAVVVGMAQTPLLTKLTTGSRGMLFTSTYLPLTAADCKRAQPLTWFLRTNRNADLGPGENLHMLSADVPPFAMRTLPATLHFETLPGPVRFHYETNQAAVADKVYLVDELEGERPRPPLPLAAATLGLILGLVLLLRALPERVLMSPKHDTRKSGKNTTAKGFTDEERAAMKERARELKAEAEKAGGEAAVLAKIAEMPEADRAMAERLHGIIKASASSLSLKTWYGMLAYAKDGKVVCFFQNAHKFKSRYATLGFSDAASLDEGAMWPTAFVLKELTAADEARIKALVKKAVG